jgi:predicted PurR-regulated permease PerM
MVSSIISSVVNFIIAFVFAVYILAQKEKLSGQVRRVMQAYLPEKTVERVQKVSSLLYTNFSNFITGQCLEAVILGGLFVICMSILRLPFALVIGILIALTALIPIAGAFIGCAVGVFLILIEDPVQALVFLVLFFVLQQIEGKLIYPKVVGNFVGLPGIWVLFAITVGGSLFGIVGMLVFIPLTATVYTLLREDVGKRIALKKQKAGRKSINEQSNRN